MSKKRLLILKTSSDICLAETNHIVTIAELVDLENEQLTLASVADISKWSTNTGNFDYIYLCGHANESGFGEEDGSNFITWSDFALALCAVNWLNAEGVLFLATCRGGLRCIADTMFSVCRKIDYICGPRWSSTGHDLTTAFHIFIYNLEVRGEEPAVAIELASASTGRHFFCYDRLECYNPVTTDILSLVRNFVEKGDIGIAEVEGFVIDTAHKKWLAAHSGKTSGSSSSDSQDEK